jgi:sorbitol-specific phosphotransferase system component IIC
MRYLQLLLFIVVFVGCSPINEGTVIKKEYKPAMTTIIPMYTNNTMTLVPQHQPERFTVYIKIGEDTGWCHLSKDAYNKAEIGDYIEC